MFKLTMREFLLRSSMSIIGLVLLSFGAALSETMGMGLDPFTALSTGLSVITGMSLGNFILLLNVLIVAIVLFFDRSRIGWGTVYNLVLVGYMIEFFMGFFANVFDISQMNLIVRLLITVGAIAIFTFGVALCMDSNLGVSPYDAVAPIIVSYTSKKFTLIRITQDVLVVLVAWIIGGPVGISTFITGFFSGPMIEFYSSRFTRKLAERL